MSVEGYFRRCIEIWQDSNTKHTPTLKRDMKEIIRQFQQSCFCEELSKEAEEELRIKFDKIYKELYK